MAARIQHEWRTGAAWDETIPLAALKNAEER